MGRQRRGDVGVGGTQPIAHPTRPPSEDGMLASGPQPCKLPPGLQAAMGGLSPRAGSTAQDHQVSRTWFRKSSAASFGPGSLSSLFRGGAESTPTAASVLTPF